MIRVIRAVIRAAQPGGATRAYFDRERAWEAKTRQGFAKITGAIAANKSAAEPGAIRLLQEMGERYKAIWKDTRIRYHVFYDCMYQVVDRRGWWTTTPPRLLGATDQEVEAIAGVLTDTLALFTQRHEGRNYSLLSKWLHFCFPDTFAIYDSHAARSIETVSGEDSVESAREGVQSTQFLREVISDTSGLGYLGLLNFYRLFWDAASSARMTSQIQDLSDGIQSLIRAEPGCGSARVTPLTLLDMLLWMSNGSHQKLGLAVEAGEQVLETPEKWNHIQIPDRRLPSTAGENTDVRRGSHPLGSLRIADNGHKPTTVFAGHVTCAHCAAAIEIEVERNPNAVSARQPAFIITSGEATSAAKPIGHLFIGTILSSPVLYYGSIIHCGTDQRIRVFFNRSLQDRTDHHLTIVRSTSGRSEASSGGEKQVKISTSDRRSSVVARKDDPGRLSEPGLRGWSTPMNIKYPHLSEFIDVLREGVKLGKSQLEQGRSIEIRLKAGGYPGKSTVIVSPDDPEEFEVFGQDPTRFPRRIRVAAWALLLEGFFGRFIIEHDRETGIVTIKREWAGPRSLA